MENQPTIEQEIAQLEKQLSEKKAALGGTEIKETDLGDKEILHEVVGEKIQQQIPSYQPQSNLTQPKPQQDHSTQSYTDPELKDKVQVLINLVFNKSLE